jgi:hypothetical protein
MDERDIEPRIVSVELPPVSTTTYRAICSYGGAEGRGSPHARLDPLRVLQFACGTVHLTVTQTQLTAVDAPNRPWLKGFRPIHGRLLLLLS